MGQLFEGSLRGWLPTGVGALPTPYSRFGRFVRSHWSTYLKKGSVCTLEEIPARKRPGVWSRGYPLLQIPAFFKGIFGKPWVAMVDRVDIIPWKKAENLEVTGV